MSARLLVDPQTPLGDADLDDHVAGGSTRSGGTPARLLPITGDRHKGEAIDVEKGRYGPPWLRDDDDDDDIAEGSQYYPKGPRTCPPGRFSFPICIMQNLPELLRNIWLSLSKTLSVRIFGPLRPTRYRVGQIPRCIFDCNTGRQS